MASSPIFFRISGTSLHAPICNLNYVHSLIVVESYNQEISECLMNACKSGNKLNIKEHFYMLNKLF